MARLDAAIRVYGRDQAELWFPDIRDTAVAIELPQLIMVNNTFVKILRPHKGGAKDVYGTGLVGPMGSTIAYREMVQFGGLLKIALEERQSSIYPVPDKSLALHINYFGKRGGFMQLTHVAFVDHLPSEFLPLNDSGAKGFQLGGLMQMLHDCGPKLTFEQVSVYSEKEKSLGLNKPNGRILRPIVLPYRMERSQPRLYPLPAAGHGVTIFARDNGFRG